MAVITVAGEPGCRVGRVAMLTARQLGWELVTDAQVSDLIESELGRKDLPCPARSSLAVSVLARLATRNHLVTDTMGAGRIGPEQMPGLLRVWVIASEAWKVGSLMVDLQLERPAARAILVELERSQKLQRKASLGRAANRQEDRDLVLNAGTFDSETAAHLIEKLAHTARLPEAGLLGKEAECRIQYKVRLELAKHGISPLNAVPAKHRFVHPSEEMFANLLDFYRIPWEYECQSFPIQWAKDGRVLESFTPDFYLPEFDLYVELTTMKQAHVTRKNRKIRLLRSHYPDVNIQIFYQRDFQDLIFKHGLAERSMQA